MSDLSETAVLTVDTLIPLLSANLSRKWLITKAKLKICKATQLFIRIESEEKYGTGRVLIALILIKKADLVVISTRKSSVEVGYITKALKKITRQHVIITSCPLYCDTCGNPWLINP